MRRRVTLRDVAELAGVSLATASRGYRRDPSISLRTQQVVVHAAEQLGYVPNAAARSLVLRATRTFAALIPDMGDPIDGQVAVAFEQEAMRHGYSVIISNTFNDPIHERRALRVVTTHRVDGIVFISSILDDDEVLTVARPTPVVFVNSENLGLAGHTPDLPHGSIRIDEEAGMTAIVDHLLSRGYRRIGYASGPRVASNITRQDALARAMRQAGETGRLHLYGAAAESWRSPHGLAKKIAQDIPDALVCYDDKLALAVSDALRQLGIRIPDDLAVVGFDDIPFAQISNPRLTTVAQPSSAMGQLAVEMLLSAIEHGTIPPSEVLPVRLLVRESTGVAQPT
jgi:LacI family transcriptional regulator